MNVCFGFNDLVCSMVTILCVRVGKGFCCIVADKCGGVMVIFGWLDRDVVGGG